MNTCCDKDDGIIFTDKIYSDITYKFCIPCVDESPDHVAGFIVGALQASTQPKYFCNSYEYRSIYN